MQKMPKLRPRIIAPVDPPHHTAEVDWDMQDDAWILDTEQYVSEPKSLKMTSTARYEWVCLCKHAGTTVLPKGRVVTQFRTNNPANARPMVYFRSQLAPGSASRSNCYGVFIGPTWLLLGRWINTTWASIDQENYYPTWSVPTDEWFKVRVTWWDEGGVLYVRFETYADDAWVQRCDDLSDVDNLWYDSTINRCGIGKSLAATGTYIVWADDTEIWGP